MDPSTEFELPSPKRIRLEGPEHGAAIDPATPVDDIDDLHDAPPVQSDSPPKSSHGPALAFDIPASPVNQKLFQLPGLGVFDGDPVFSSQTSKQQPQSSSFLETEQRSSADYGKQMELEDGQKTEVNSGLDSAVDDEQPVNTQTTEPEDNSSVPSEILVNGNATTIATSGERVLEADAPSGLDSAIDEGQPANIQTTELENIFAVPNHILVNGIATAIAKSEEGGLEAEAPVDQDVTSSGSALSQVPCDWHSSGTVIDNQIWLGGYSIENLLSTAPDSITAKAGTSKEVLQHPDVGQNGDSVQNQLISGTELDAERSEETVFTEHTSEKLAEANKDNEEAEFELDSSPLGSESSSDDSTDTSSSDDSDADDYEMLSPAEQARRLMAEDGGSDNDGKSKGHKAVAEIPRTLNEKPDEFVPKSTVTVTQDMKIEELGLTENIVENLALIKANISGEYQVLESGSLLCLHDRSVIGVVSETLGRVQQPYYSVRFTNAAAIAEAGIAKGTKIYYVAQHSSTVFTQPLKAFKGSDASNLHDEEVGDDELEFSDDEAEAEHKQQIKQQRMAKRTARDGQPDGFSRGPQQRPGAGPRPDGGLHSVQEHAPSSAETALNYDDVDGMNVGNKEDEDGLYTPLTRPSNLHEILSGKAPPMNSQGVRGNTNRGRGDSRGVNRGRGDNRRRGDNRGRGGRMGDSERGGHQNRKDYGNRGGKGQSHGHPIPRTPQTNRFTPPQSSSLPPRPSPETIGYQKSTQQGNGFPHPPPQQSPIPSPAYQTQQQPQYHTHPGYPSQYPNTYNQPYFQQPPHQPYPPHIPQQDHSQYHQPQQPIPHQSYVQQYAPQPDMSFPPRPQYPPSIPPGAHINPNLFKQQGLPPSPQNWQQGYHHQQQQQQLASPASTNTGSPAPASNESRLQELLRGLGKRGR